MADIERETEGYAAQAIQIKLWESVPNHVTLAFLPLLGRYGSYETFKTPAGDSITVLPTCQVPISYLDRTNWAKTLQMGNFRSVWSIDALQDGTRPHLVAKSPERTFTAEKALLDRGWIWWGGTRSGERFIRLSNSPAVEQQAIWEAVILLELASQGVKVETPQALVQQPNGCIELVVKEISADWFGVRSKGPSYNEVLESIKNATSIIPVDASRHNCIRDQDGCDHVIDVNRWLWPPYTDSYRGRLLDEITTAVRNSYQVV